MAYKEIHPYPPGILVEVSTPEAMATLLTESNLNRVYKYTGTTTASYKAGRLYKVINKQYDPPVQEDDKLSANSFYTMQQVGDTLSVQ